MAKPSERSLELAEVALESAVSACAPIGSSRDDSDMSKLAREYEIAANEIAALRKELYP